MPTSGLQWGLNKKTCYLVQGLSPSKCLTHNRHCYWYYYCCYYYYYIMSDAWIKLDSVDLKINQGQANIAYVTAFLATKWLLHSGCKIMENNMKN